MLTVSAYPSWPQLRRAALYSAAFCAFGAYVAMATMATLFIPPVLAVFIAPLALIGFLAAPQGRSVPRKIIWPLIVLAAAMMPVWPVYLHVKLGPTPILTPPRILFYVITAIWLYDMASSPLRRGQFLVAIRRSPWLAGLIIGLFALNALSVPIAVGTRFAAQEFFRQFIIWFLPFCAFITYVRTLSQLRTLLLVTISGAGLVALIAAVELGSGTLLVTKLAPLISDSAAWLQITQELKARDGAFRAQATHTHPLSLGEYLGMCAPVALGFAVAARGRARQIWAFLLLLILAGVIATNARGAMLGVAAGFLVTGAVLMVRILRSEALSQFRPLIGLASLALLASSPLIGVALHKTITGEAGTSAARSSQARIDQLKLGWPKILARPIGGHGTGRAVRIIGYWGKTLSVDNYYLTLGVELGFPGPIVFLLILIVVARKSFAQAQGAPPKIAWMLYGLAGAMAAFGVSRLILSQTGNLSFVYPLLGAYIGASARMISARRTALSR